MEGIRRILDSLDLATDPDFETAWIDSPIWLRLKEGIQIATTQPFSSGVSTENGSEDIGDLVLEGTPSAVAQAEQQSESAPISAEPDTPQYTTLMDASSIEDPTFRIGSLPAANRKLVVVNQDVQ